jgi:hypothetical protein
MIYNLLRTMQFLREEVSKCFLLMFGPYSALPEGLCVCKSAWACSFPNGTEAPSICQRDRGSFHLPTGQRLLPSANGTEAPSICQRDRGSFHLPNGMEAPSSAHRGQISSDNSSNLPILHDLLDQSTDCPYEKYFSSSL